MFKNLLKSQHLYILFGLLFFSLYVFITVKASGDSLWVNQSGFSFAERGESPIESFPDPSVIANNQNHGCSWQKFAIEKYTQVATNPYTGQPLWSELPQRISKDVCATRSRLGWVISSTSFPGASIPGDTTASYVVLPGTNVAQRVEGGRLLAVPNSKLMLLYNGTHSSSGPGPTVRFMYSIIGAGDSVISDTGERVFRIRASARPDPFMPAASTGFNTGFNNVAFSENGEWAVGVSGYGLIRKHIPLVGVDPNDSYQVISRLPFGFGDYYTFAISNDGRYVISQSINGGAVHVYDLLNCQPRTALDGYSLSNTPLTPGCLRRDIRPEIAARYPGFQTLRKVRFNSSGSALEASILNTGQTVLKNIEIQSGTFSEQSKAYIALGDSFASGEGDMDDSWYVPGTNVNENKCHQSARSYPYLISLSLGYIDSPEQSYLEDSEFKDMACSGARILDLTSQQKDRFTPPNNILGDWIPGANSNGQSFWGTGSHHINPSSVTVSIGGNDVGFVNNLIPCVISATSCNVAVDPAAKYNFFTDIASQYDELVEAYTDIKEKAGKTYVIGYPQFIQKSGGNCALNVRLDDNERVLTTEATAYLNKVIESAASKAGVTYVDVSNMLYQRNLCSGASPDQMSVNGITIGDDNSIFGFESIICFNNSCIGNESYHPNQNAQPLYRNWILAATQNFTAENPTPQPNQLIPYPDGSFWPAEVNSYVDFLNNPSTHPNPIPPKKYDSFVNKTYNMRQLEINTDFLKPGSSVRVMLHSDPTDLGSFPVGSTGEFQANITIPGNVEPGVHTITIEARNLADEPVTYQQKVLVGGVDENDTDGDGVENDQDECLFIEASGVDADQDGTDDACDGFIDEAPESEQIAQSEPEDKVINETEAKPNDSYILGGMQQTSNSSTGQDLQPMGGVSSGEVLQGSSLQGSGAQGAFQGSSVTQVAGESTGLQTAGQLTQQQIAENIDSTVSPKETNGSSALLFAVFGAFLLVGLFAVGLNQFRKSRD